MISDYRWEYSPLAKLGNAIWTSGIDPLLRLLANDLLTLFRRLRGLIQIILLTAILFLIAGLFHPTHLITASGLLFDIAGVLRIFLLEELTEALEPFKEGKPPSVAIRMVTPEALGPYTTGSSHASLFYYNKRGVLFLFLGFVLQMIGDFVG